MYEFLPIIGILCFIVVIGILIQMYFRGKGKSLSSLKVHLRTPNDIKPIGCFIGKNGKNFVGEIIDGEVSGDLAKVVIDDKVLGKIELSPVHLKENVILPTDWSVVFGNGIMIGFNIDATNRVCDWQENKELILKNRELELERKKLEGKEEIIKAVEIANAITETNVSSSKKEDKDSSIYGAKQW